MIAAFVGWTSSFAVVLTGLRTVGAGSAEAGSGLVVVSLLMGLGSIAFSLRTRTPVTLAWSTPGAALLASAAAPSGGYAAAVGAFVLAGVLYLLTAAIAPLGRWVRRIPTSLANAMLAGVLLTLCVAPFRALADHPGAVAPVLVTWALALAVVRRWAVPLAFLAAVVVIVATGSTSGLAAGDLVPHLTWTTPHADLAAAVALGVPLYLVTMTSQNLPGVAVLGTFGYPAPLRAVLAYCGVATVATAGMGGYTVNLAAISAALSAGPAAGPDPARRWVAGVSNGVTACVLGVGATAVTAVATLAPAGVLAAVAGVALLASFGSAAATALADEGTREPAALAFVVAASGVTIAGVGSAFWSLVAGGALLLLLRVGAGRGLVGVDGSSSRGSVVQVRAAQGGGGKAGRGPSTDDNAAKCVPGPRIPRRTDGDDH